RSPTCTSLPTVFSQLARYSVQPEIRMYRIETRVGRAVGPVLRLPRTLQRWAWAATHAVRSAFQPFTMVSWAFEERKGWQAALVSFRYPARRTSADQSVAP